MKFQLNKVLDSKRDELLGLDIGSSAVKMVQLRKEHQGYSVIAAAKVDIVNGKDSNIADIGVVKAVQECLRRMTTEMQMAVCSVCGPEVAVRRFNFPVLPKEEVANAIMLEAAQVCPFNLSESIIDYQIVPNGKDSIRGLLVAATDRLVQKKRWFAEEAALRPVLMDVDGLALLNCLEKCIRESRKIAVLNIGSSFTTLAVSNNDNLPFIRDIGYAGNDIIGNIASHIGIEPADVRNNLCGPKSQNADTFNLKNALPFACQKLIEDISETLRYHSANEKVIVDQIYICGGFALVDGFIDLLKRSFPANVQIWNPFDNYTISVPSHLSDLLKKEGASMAVAAGLAMRTI